MRILVAVDGSARAADAVALVASITWPSDSVLRVITVIEPTVFIPGPLDAGGLVTPEVDKAITGYAHDVVRHALAQLGSCGCAVDGAVLRGRAASTITSDARDFKADLLVVGSRGRGTIASLLLGSVASEVVDHAQCPVLVARTRSVGRVVFATDDSPAAQAAELVLATWPIFAELPIRVVSVVDVARPSTSGLALTLYAETLDAYAEELVDAKDEHRRIASDCAARLREAGLVADAEVRVGDAAEEIIAVVEAERADLAVLGTRGRTGIRRLLLGSVARNVLSGSAASILIARDAVSVIDQPSDHDTSDDARHFEGDES